MAMGMLTFFVFLVALIQISFNLYATSVVSSLALDAARDVAEFDGLTPREAEAEFRQHIGSDVQFSVRTEGEVVSSRVVWERTSIFPTLGDFRVFGVLDRTFSVRVEQPNV